MARAKGRDVLVEMMETVAKLEATATAHATKLEALAVHAVQSAVETTALRLGLGELATGLADVSKRMNDVSKRMDDVAKRVDGLSDRTGHVLQRVGALETENHALAQGFVDTAKLARTQQQQLGQLARLVKEQAGNSKTRLDEIEDRVVALERKAG